MSVYVRAHFVIGVCFSTEPNYVETKKRGCKHDYVEGSNFCSICGKPIFVISKTNITPDFKELECLFHRNSGSLAVVRDYEDKKLYFGKSFMLGEYDNVEFNILSEKDILAIRDEIEAALRPLDLWNPTMQVKNYFFTITS